jgi:hypothetical protein
MAANVEPVTLPAPGSAEDVSVSEEVTWGQLVERAERRHFVQFYGKDENALAQNVSLYLAEGLARDEALIVVATPAHYALFRDHLERMSEAARSAVREERIVYIPAADLLGKIVAGGQPDWSVFEAAVSGAMTRARGDQPSRKVRAYGEMVGLLWEQGRRSTAEQLEDFWNRLFATQCFELYCAYPIDVFGSEFQLRPVDNICCEHTHVIPAANGESLEDALEFGMHDILGPELEPLRGLMKSNFRPAWAAIPKGEALILWLRNNLPEKAEHILARARAYYEKRKVSGYVNGPGEPAR